MSQTPARRGPILSSLAAMGSLVAALGCCLPTMPFLAAAGVAGVSTLLIPLRPYLVVASVLLLGVGFFQAYGASRCGARANPLSAVILWAAALATVCLLLFPQVIAGWVADWK